MTTSPSMFKWTIFSLTLLFCTPSFAKKVYGTFRVVKRDVKVISFKKKKTISARPGMKVYPKDTIVAGKNSRAKVVMVDKNVINISPDTKVNFANYVFEPKKKKKAVLLNVLYGKIRSKVNQKYNGKDNKFQVKTPSAVAGVRGTDFFVNYNRQIKKTDVVTFEGKVKFGLPGANNSIRNGVDVNVGQIASSTSGQRPNTPKNIPPSQLAKFDKNSNSDKAGEPDRKEPAPKNKPKKTKKKKENQPKKEPKAQADDKSAKNDKKDPAKAKGDKAPKKQNAANEPKNEPKRANAQGKKPNGPSPTATNNSAAPPKPGDGSTPGKSPRPTAPLLKPPLVPPDFLLALTEREDLPVFLLLQEENLCCDQKTLYLLSLKLTLEFLMEPLTPLTTLTS